MTASERLRRYVRARVRKDGALYQWGAAARLGAAIGKTSGWISEYVDDNPPRHADIDTALAICRFYGVTLAAFEGTPVTPSATSEPAAIPLSRNEARALRLLRLMNERGQRLSVKMLAGYADEFPKRTSQESPVRASQKREPRASKARGTP